MLGAAIREKYILTNKSLHEGEKNEKKGKLKRTNEQLDFVMWKSV